jgi:hypothetical protein
MALDKGFKLKMPYADRIDKHQTRTINFYCYLSKSANRKVGCNGCPFRIVYKSKLISSK